MRPKSISIMLLIIVFLVGCGNPTEFSSKAFFKNYLNMDSPPEGVSEFTGQAQDKFPVVFSRGYFKYRAEESYFRTLTEHRKFFQKSTINQSVHEVKCNEIPQDFSYWTNDTINPQKRICYEGIFVPYIHYIVYDAMTKQAFHFIDGIRD